MPRYKGRASCKTIERDYPHIVEIAVPLGGLGNRVDAMRDWHRARGIEARAGRGRHTDEQDFISWCFADAKLAADFAAEFGSRYAMKIR